MSAGNVRIRLKDLVIAQKGVKPALLRKNQFENSVPYLDIVALEDGIIRGHTLKLLGTYCDKNDVLVVWDGSRSGLPLLGREGVVGSTIMRLTPVGLDSEYLYYFLRHTYDFINLNLTGGGIPHAPSDLFFDLRIPLLEISKQRKLIRDLKIKLNENKKIIVQHENLIRENLNEFSINYSDGLTIEETFLNFRKTLLNEALSGKHSEDWRKKNSCDLGHEVSLSDLIVTIKSGKSFRCLERTPINNEIGVIKISAVSSLEYQEDQSKTCIDNGKINESLFIKSQDFLMSRANTKELVGSCVIVKKVSKKIMLSDKILKITFDKKLVLDEFMLLFLRSPQARNQIENFASGTQESMKNITQDQIKNIKLLLPTLKEQKQIVKSVREVFRIVDNIEKKYRNAVKSFNDLEKAILNSTFENNNEEYDTNAAQELITMVYDEKKRIISERSEITKSQSKLKNQMKKSITEVSKLEIEEVIAQSKETLTAKEVWKASKYKEDIDAFYESLKGKMSKSISSEMKKEKTEEPEVILKLKLQAI